MMINEIKSASLDPGVSCRFNLKKLCVESLFFDHWLLGGF